jgi:hypothetical protein
MSDDDTFFSLHLVETTFEDYFAAGDGDVFFHIETPCV